MSSRMNAAALVLALAAPVAFWPGALDRWVLPKVLLIGAAALISVAGVSSGRLPRWLWLCLAAGIALIVVAAVAGGHPVAALLGRWPRYEGVVTATGYLVALWLGARLLGPGAGAGVSRLFDRALATLSVVLGVWAVVEALGARPLPSDLARPGGLLGNATDQGAVGAILATVLAARLLSGSRSRAESAFLAVAAALAALSVIVSGSRAALIALALGVVLAVLLLAARRRRVLVAAAVSLGALALAAVVTPGMGARLADAGAAVADRALIWSEAGAVIARHPLLGVGPSGFLDAVAAEHGVNWYVSDSDGSVLDSPHNVLLQALVVAGPLGVVTVAGVLIAAVVSIGRRVRSADAERRALVIPAALGGGVALLVLLTHVTAPATVLPAMLLAGAALAREPATASDRSAWAGRLVAIPLTAWIALTALTLAGETALGTGVAATHAGRIADAESAFGTAAALRPWDADTPIIAAEALTARADAGDASALGAAISWSERALDAAPESLAAGRAAATNAIASGDLDRAAAVLDVLLEKYPREPWVAHRAGAVALALGDFARAEVLLLRAAELDPGREEPRQTLEYLYELQAGQQTSDAG